MLYCGGPGIGNVGDGYFPHLFCWVFWTMKVHSISLNLLCCVGLSLFFQTYINFFCVLLLWIIYHYIDSKELLFLCTFGWFYSQKPVVLIRSLKGQVSLSSTWCDLKMMRYLIMLCFISPGLGLIEHWPEFGNTHF